MPSCTGVWRLLQCATQPINYRCMYACVFTHVVIVPTVSGFFPSFAPQWVLLSHNWWPLISLTHPDRPLTICMTWFMFFMCVVYSWHLQPLCTVCTTIAPRVCTLVLFIGFCRFLLQTLCACNNVLLLCRAPAPMACLLRHVQSFLS